VTDCNVACERAAAPFVQTTKRGKKAWQALTVEGHRRGKVGFSTAEAVEKI